MIGSVVPKSRTTKANMKQQRATWRTVRSRTLTSHHFRMNHTFTILQYSFQTPRNQITKVGSHKHSQQQIEPSQKRFKKSISEDLHFTYLQPTEVFSNKFFMMYSASGHNSQWNHTCMSDSLQVKRVYETTCVCLIHCRQVFSRRSKQSMKPQVYVWFTVNKYSADGHNSLSNHTCMSDSLSTSIQGCLLL